MYRIALRFTVKRITVLVTLAKRSTNLVILTLFLQVLNQNATLKSHFPISTQESQAYLARRFRCMFYVHAVFRSWFV